MNYSKSTALVAALGLITLTTGCATATGGTHQSVSVKTQKESVDVVGADCVLTNSKGTWKVTTPGTTTVHRAKDDLLVRCTKDGTLDAISAFQSSTRKGAVAGNILMLGLVGLAAQGVDSATGGAYAYPDEITVTFGRSATLQTTFDAPNASASRPSGTQSGSALSSHTSSPQEN